MKTFLFVLLVVAVALGVKYFRGPAAPENLSPVEKAEPLTALPRPRPVAAKLPRSVPAEGEPVAPSPCTTAEKELSKTLDETGSAEGVQEVIERFSLASACGEASPELQEKVKKLSESCQGMEDAGLRGQFTCLQGTVALLQAAGELKK